MLYSEIKLKAWTVCHVYQGRYKVVLVQKDAYLFELARYVVLNPIRAQMINDMLGWQWSRYPAMIGKTDPPEWLETNWVLNYFGVSRNDAISSYINFVREGIGLPSVWGGLKQQLYLGDEKFVEKQQARIDLNEKDTDLKEAPRIQRRAIAKVLNWYESHASSRDQAIVQAYACGDYSMKDIAVWYSLFNSESNCEKSRGV